MCIFSIACKACVPCIFTLLMTLAQPATRGDTSLNSFSTDKDKSESDKKQTEDKALGTKEKETGQFS